MEEQETQARPTEKLISTAGEMIETYRDLITLTIIENVSLGVSVSVVGIVSLVFFCGLRVLAHPFDCFTECPQGAHTFYSQHGDQEDL